MSHVRIFDNPKGAWLEAGNYPPIVLSGTFDDYNTSQAYESRVQISGHVGNCAVFLDSETNLPPGYTLTVDNDTDEVVLRWPAYQVLSLSEADIPNAGFELGDNGDWVKGYLWEIGAYAANQVYEGTKSAQFSQGEKSITSRINAAHPRTCSAGTSVTASCQVQQGQSDAGNAGAWVWIEFLDSNGDVLTHTEGNHVTSGSNSAWHQSSVTAVAPTNTVSARIGAEAFRNRHQDYNLWVDDFQWDLPPEVDDFVGTNETNTINLCLHVVDSLGRTAEECYVIEAYVAPPSILFVAAGGITAGQVKTTTDGLTWTSRSTGSTALTKAVGYGNGWVVMADADAKFWRSDDSGVTWSAATTAAFSPSGQVPKSIAYGNGTFVCVTTSTGTSNTRVYYSTDNGDNWTEATLPSISAGNTVHKVSFVNNVFLFRKSGIAGTASYLYTSANGSVWSASSTLNAASCIGEDGSRFILFYGSGQSYYSSNGAAWTAGASIGSGQNQLVQGYPGGAVVHNLTTTSAAKAYRRTTDHGATWSSAPTNASGSAYCSAYAGGIMIFAGNGFAHVSSDLFDTQSTVTPFGSGAVLSIAGID